MSKRKSPFGSDSDPVSGSANGDRRRKRRKRVKEEDRQDSYCSSVINSYALSYPIVLRNNTYGGGSVPLEITIRSPPFSKEILNEAKGEMIPDLFNIVNRYLGKTTSREVVFIEEVANLRTAYRATRRCVLHRDILSALKPVYRNKMNSLNRDRTDTSLDSSSEFVSYGYSVPAALTQAFSEDPLTGKGLLADRLYIILGDDNPDVEKMGAIIKERGGIAVYGACKGAVGLSSPIWDAVIEIDWPPLPPDEVTRLRLFFIPCPLALLKSSERQEAASSMAELPAAASSMAELPAAAAASSNTDRPVST